MKRHANVLRAETVTVIVVIGMLASVAITRANAYREWLERAGVESVLGELRQALRIRMGNLLIHGEHQRWGLLARQNPFDWLEQKPANYCGINHNPRSQRSGCWTYSPEIGEIAYRPILHDGLFTHYSPEPLLRWQVRALYSAKEIPESVDSRNNNYEQAQTVVLESLTPYRWN